MSRQLFPGIYDALVSEDIRQILDIHPELRTVFAKIDSEEQPARYSAFVAKVLERALREETKVENRLELCNQIIGLLSNPQKKQHLSSNRLIESERSLLLEITPQNFGAGHLSRPHTPMAESSLFTGSPKEPQVAHELIAEMGSADGVDILVSFIKWSGLRLLMPAFENLRDRNVPVRLITTSYMGASDAPAVERLASLPNVEVHVSYDVERTRLHAKAYHFIRKSGFSTAYIGSANMSHAAMTSGLEWNLKVTEQDMPHILEKFKVEFDTYWNCHDFTSFDPENPAPFRNAIARARNPQRKAATVFFDLTPRSFQERILEALEREREIHGRWKNLVIAATGTGKTVIAAFDYKRFFVKNKGQARLLFVAHRQEILEQALATFRNVLRDQNFGDLLVGQHLASRYDHLFCSVQMLSNKKIWDQVGSSFYDFIIVDEAHHGTAASYRSVFEHFQAQILLGLTATPERMDGKNVAADFDNRFAAEIRLVEALDEKLLCPFHYFGVADPIAINDDRFWKNGKYSESELENVYVLDRQRAKQRVGVILAAIERYEPDLGKVRGIGFCVGIKHAEYMAEQFSQLGIPSAAIVSTTNDAQKSAHMDSFKNGTLMFLFTVDKLSEGVDIPEINTVLFLRPTDSLTVFLQQLGRGLRHSPEKDCLTVIDLVGQVHRRCRVDLKFKALLPRHRFSIDREVGQNFPHLPAGCSIQLDRLSRQYVLTNIKENLGRLAVQVPDRLQTFYTETGNELTFGNFVKHHKYEPEALLAKETWSGWKAKAQLCSIPQDPDLKQLQQALLRACFVSGPAEISLLKQVLKKIANYEIPDALRLAGSADMSIYYRIWGDKGSKFGFDSVEDSFVRLAQNPVVLSDLDEILSWSLDSTQVAGKQAVLPFACSLELHAQYGIKDIQAVLGKANLETAGQTGVGVLHFPEIKAYVLLITFQKTDREFSPSTMYADYPLSRDLLHWESQANTAQHHKDGQNLIHHEERGYTILVFSRDQKKRNGVTVPFTYLGPVSLVRYEGERPIKMVWRLLYRMPVEMFEDNRMGG